MSKDFSELQAVDVAVGAFIAKAFDGLTVAGSKEFQEFLQRPTNKKIYRHDAADPTQFLKDFLSSGKGEVKTGNVRNNQVPLPLVYYYRKPGFTNSEDKKDLRGRYSWNTDLTKSFNFMVLTVFMDYSMTFIAWDKATLDRMCLAWYAYIVRHDMFTVKYNISGENFDVKGFALDNKTVTLADNSQPLENGRIYAISTPVSISTQIMYGEQVTLPDVISVVGGLDSTVPTAYDAGTGNGTTTDFTLDTAAAVGKEEPFKAGTVEVKTDSVAVAYDDGQGAITNAAKTISGTVDYVTGTVNVSFDTPPIVGIHVTIEAVVDSESSVVISSGCQYCHDYRSRPNV